MQRCSHPEPVPASTADGGEEKVSGTIRGPPLRAGEDAKPGLYFTCSVLFARSASGSACAGSMVAETTLRVPATRTT